MPNKQRIIGIGILLLLAGLLIALLFFRKTDLSRRSVLSHRSEAKVEAKAEDGRQKTVVVSNQLAVNSSGQKSVNGLRKTKDKNAERKTEVIGNQGTVNDSNRKTVNGKQELEVKQNTEKTAVKATSKNATKEANQLINLLNKKVNGKRSLLKLRASRTQLSNVSSSTKPRISSASKNNNNNLSQEKLREQQLDNLSRPSQGGVASEDTSLNFNSQDLGFANGPFSLGATYSKLGEYMLTGQVAQKFFGKNAYSLAFELGKSQRRINLTLGRALTKSQRLKLTAEYLTQNLNFDFLTGSVKEWVGQPAFGLAYQYIVTRGILNAVNLDLTYSKAQSKDLPIIIQTGNGYYLADYRRIAGGTDKSASLGVDLLPTKKSLVNLQINYDNLKYDMHYHPSAEDASGLGFTVSLEQLLSKYFKFKISALNRKPYNQYQAELDWLMHTKPGTRLEIGFLGGYTKGSGSLPNDSSFGVNVNYSFDGSPLQPRATYNLGAREAAENLAAWVSVPAVRMAEVLAIKDELIKEIHFNGLNPNQGPICGGTPVTLTGSGFGSAGSVASIVFGGQPASKVMVNNDNEISAITPRHLTMGPVSVVLTKTSGESVTLANAYTYTSAGSCQITMPTNNASFKNQDTKKLFGLNEGGSVLTAICPGLFANQAKANASQVTIAVGDVPAQVEKVEGNKITFRTPAMRDSELRQPLDIIIKTPSLTYKNAKAFTYYKIKLNPTQGDTGNKMTITVDAPHAVQNLFTKDVEVDFSNTKVQDQVTQDHSEIDCTVPAPPSKQKKVRVIPTVKVKVINNHGTGDQSGGTFTYSKLIPQITSLSPNFGLTGGGNKKIVIHGTNLDEVNSVTFDGSQVPFTKKGATEIDVNSIPAHVAGKINVVAHDPDGSSSPVSENSKFTYYDLTLHPPQGSTAGGDTVKITASDATKEIFQNNVQVTFAGQSTTITAHTTKEITLTTPAHSGENLVNVLVTNVGADSSTQKFTYKILPVIDNVTRYDKSPAVILTGGGKIPLNKPIIMHGSHFTGADWVKIDGQPAEFTVLNDTQIKLTKIPAHTAGDNIQVQVHTPKGTSSPKAGFDYRDLNYTLTPIKPLPHPAARVDGGDMVTISLVGSGDFTFDPATKVYFGNTKAASIKVSGNTIKATTPPHAYGRVDLKIINGDATDSESAITTTKFDYSRVYLVCPEASDIHYVKEKHLAYCYANDQAGNTFTLSGNRWGNMPTWKFGALIFRPSNKQWCCIYYHYADGKITDTATIKLSKLRSPGDVMRLELMPDKVIPGADLAFHDNTYVDASGTICGGFGRRTDNPNNCKLEYTIPISGNFSFAHH